MIYIKRITLTFVVCKIMFYGKLNVDLLVTGVVVAVVDLRSSGTIAPV